MKVLILAYDFPPLISIGGQRPYGWCKYLPEAGISVTVVTRQWSESTQSPVDYVLPVASTRQEEILTNGSKIIKVPYAPNMRDRLLIRYGFNRFVGLRKILSFWYSYIEHLFLMFDAKAPIYYEALKEIEKNRPDFIIATGEPFILFKYGQLLSSKFNIPWVADFRDSWTSNQGNYRVSLLQKLQNAFYQWREKRYLSAVSLITTASPTYVPALQAIHTGKKIEVVYNGFFDEFFQNMGAINPPVQKFVISYAGTIYPHQNLEMFLDGLSQFVIKENVTKDKLEVRFYGIDSQPAAKARLLDYKPELLEFIVPLPRVPYGELMKELRASHLLLLLSQKNAGWLNAKVFDYLAVQRKIMLVENDHGILEKLLKETGGGEALNSINEVLNFLILEYGKFIGGKASELASNGSYLRYSRKKQALALGDLLKSLKGIEPSRF